METTLHDRLDAITGMADGELTAAGDELAAEMLAMGEIVLEGWIRSKDQEPTDGESEGFRLLALHRQGAKGDPSFNACRETCRELVYLHNCVKMREDDLEVAGQLRLAAAVTRHLALFIDGKLENAGLGEFCCASKPLRLTETAAGAAGNM